MKSRLRPWILLTAGLLLVAITLLFCRLSAARKLQDGCVKMLAQIDGAKEQWAMDNHKTTNNIPTWNDLAPYWRREVPRCPQGGSYTLTHVGELDMCSFPAHTEAWREMLRKDNEPVQRAGASRSAPETNQPLPAAGSRR